MPCSSSEASVILEYDCKHNSDASKKMSGTIDLCSADNAYDALRSEVGTDLLSYTCRMRQTQRESDADPYRGVFMRNGPLETGFATDCGPNPNIRSDVIMVNRYVCQYKGEIEIDGKTYYDRDASVTGFLPSCKLGKKADAQLMTDIESIAFERMNGTSLGLEKKRVSCKVMGI